MPERVLERSVEDELVTAARAAFRLETIQEPRAMAMAALVLVGRRVLGAHRALAAATTDPDIWLSIANPYNISTRI